MKSILRALPQPAKYAHLALVILLAAGAAHAENNCPPPGLVSLVDEAMAGHNLSATEAANLARIVARHPDDLSARTKLLGYYFGREYASPAVEEARRKHILWVIANRPETEIAGLPYTQIDEHLDKLGYDQAKELWLKQAKSHPQDPLILAHAAQFFFLDDKALAEKLLQQAKAAEPDNPEWPDRLGHLYALHGGKDSAAKALAEYELAQAIEKSEFSRFVRLGKLAKSSFDAGETEKASSYANKLLNTAEKYHNWNYGNAIHQGNTVLGRIALKQGDVKLAGEYLLKAGATPGSPQLDSFGPNMALAKELLEKGERDTVLRYFELCRKFWEMGGKQLDNWTKRVQDNQMPDFGANLVY